MLRCAPCFYVLPFVRVLMPAFVADGVERSHCECNGLWYGPECSQRYCYRRAPLEELCGGPDRGTCLPDGTPSVCFAVRFAASTAFSPFCRYVPVQVHPQWCVCDCCLGVLSQPPISVLVGQWTGQECDRFTRNAAPRSAAASLRTSLLPSLALALLLLRPLL